MQTIVASKLSFAERASEELREWPALEICLADCGAGVGFAAGARQIVHLHWPGEAELCLTWPVIERLSAALTGSERVCFVAGSDWIRLRLESDSDVRLLVPLVSLAIQVNTRASHEHRYSHRARCLSLLSAPSPRRKASATGASP